MGRTTAAPAAHRAARGELQNGVIGQRGAEQHRAVGPPVGCDTERNRDGQQVEQVAEVGVMTKRGVAVDRRRQHLVDGERGADRRYHHHIHLPPERGHQRLELGQPLQRGECVDRRVLLASTQDFPHDGKDGFRLRGKEVPELHQSLGHPWPLIQKRPGSQERLQ